jgi:hypothetical protein
MITTRRGLIGAAAASALAQPAAALAAGTAGSAGDRGLLEVLVRYGEVVVFSYELALHSAPLRGRDRATLRTLSNLATLEDDAIRLALKRNGGFAPPRRPVEFAKLPPQIAHKAGRDAYLRYVVRNEEGLVSGWYATVQKFTDVKLVEGAAKFMADGGRRLVLVRRMAGLPLLPRAFETGTG